MGPASVHGSVPLGPHLPVVMHDGIEDRGQHAPMRTAVGSQPVQDELGDRGVTNQVSAAQDLKVS
jgi:hypothetical protein